MLRVITINLNGIRSAARRGFFPWMLQQNADIVCVQEIKAQESDIQDALFRPLGYHAYFHCAEKKGYSGVGIYSKMKPDAIITGLGWYEADTEGRYIEAIFGKLHVVSLYLPSGTSGEHRQNIKFDFLQRFTQHLERIKRQSGPYILTGDWNIAHRAIDLKNWRSNQKHSGFLPEERAWMDVLFETHGFVDAFRQINSAAEQYTWWSHRGRAWEKNVGWRIDYQVVSPGLKDTVLTASIFKDQRFSDHAPLLIDYDVKIDHFS